MFLSQPRIPASRLSQWSGGDSGLGSAIPKPQQCHIWNCNFPFKYNKTEVSVTDLTSPPPHQKSSKTFEVKIGKSIHTDTYHIKILYATCNTEVEVIIVLDGITTYFNWWLAVKIWLIWPFTSVCQTGLSKIPKFYGFFSSSDFHFSCTFRNCHFTAISNEIVQITANSDFLKTSL